MDNTLRDLQNSSYPTETEFNNCFIIHSKYFSVLKGVSPFRSLFSAHQKNTTLSPGFLGNSSIICSELHFWRRFDVIGSIIFSGLHFWLHWFNIWWTAAGYGELCVRFLIINNYSPKRRWRAMDFYRAAQRRGKYPPLTTDTEVNSCFSTY